VWQLLLDQLLAILCLEDLDPLINSQAVLVDSVRVIPQITLLSLGSFS
jgi:hypothetical protein